jgi:predicted RNA-binding Zn-ribbon protein involved in translation (DUF1610 family)
MYNQKKKGRKIKMDKVEYYYCDDCGYEGNDVVVEFSATYANGDYYLCPICGHENLVLEEE